MRAFVINLDRRPDRLKEFYRNKFPFPVERFSAVDGACGEDGCTQSHLNILRSQTEFPFVVFEDDCDMLRGWDVVEAAMKQLPADWDALWLGATLYKPLQRYSPNLFILRKAYALQAVIYNSQRMINYILKNHNTPSGKNLDIFYHYQVQKCFNCFIVYPLVAGQRSGMSDISKIHQDFNDEIIPRYNKYTSHVSKTRQGN